MKAYILSKGLIVSPFDESVQQSWIRDKTLLEWQLFWLKEFNLKPQIISNLDQVKAGEEFILLWDNLFFTRRVLKDFLKKIKSSREPLQAALKECTYLSKYSHLQDLKKVKSGQDKKLSLFNLFYFPAFTFKPQEYQNLAKPYPVYYREYNLKVPTPENIMGTKYWEHPVTSSILMHVNHWVHILWVNQLIIQVSWVDHILDNKLWTLRQFTRSLRFNSSSFFWRLLKNFNKIARGCSIHPTAVVEASFLDEGVKIGAFAMVRGSYIGTGTIIEDRANVNYSVVGHHSFISKNSTLVGCVGYPEGDLCVNGMQFCLTGKKCALTSLVHPLDSLRGEEIKVMAEGKLVSSGSPLLGCCFGHNCFVGADVHIAPGREVPNGAYIISGNDHLLVRSGDKIKPGVPMVIKDGQLAPWSKTK